MGPRAATLALVASCFACSANDGSSEPRRASTHLDAGDGCCGLAPGGDAGVASPVCAVSDAGGGDLDLTARPFAPRDVNHVLFVGQSNSVSNGATPPVSLAQPYGNLTFSGGVMSAYDCPGNDGCRSYQAPAGFAPLVEGDRYYDYAVETPSSGLANEATKRALASGQAKHDVLVTLHGRSGWTYWCLRKGGCDYKPAGYVWPFAQGMREVSDAKALAQAMGKSYVVRAVAAVHGESDQQGYFAGTPEFPRLSSDGASVLNDYSDGLVEWQKDYEAGVKAITGQSEPVPLLVTQLSGQNSTRVAVVAQHQLDAHVKAPGKVVLAGPTYQVSFAKDCLHYDARGSRWVGEYIGKAYAKVVVEGKDWEPLRVWNVTRVGAMVLVAYRVPVPPLVLDTTRVTDPGSYGFSYTSRSGANVPILKAETLGIAVRLTLASAEAGTLSYAQNQVPGTCIGPGTVMMGGARGNLRDSDATVSQSGNELFNWGVAYTVAVE